MRAVLCIVLTAVGAVLTADRSCRADEAFSIVIDPFTGSAALRNDSPQPVDLDGYLLTSPTPILNLEGWSSLQDNAVPGWLQTTSSAGNRLGETNLFGSLTIASGSSVSIGAPYTPFTPTAIGQPEPGLNTFRFSYTLANEDSPLPGDVEFSSRNTVVLVVEPQQGTASLVNQSAFDIALDSYLITSKNQALNGGSWTPLADANSQWTAAPGAANRLAEGNLFDATPLAANGGRVSIGSPIDPTLLTDESELALTFTIAGFEAPISGGVLFNAGPIPGDYDFDGDVDSNDLGIFLGLWTGALDVGLPELAFPNGDLTGDLDVDSEDLGVFLANWTGSFDASSVVASASAVVVPEPSGLGLCLLGLFGFCVRRRQSPPSFTRK